MLGQLNRFRIEGLHHTHTIDIQISDNKLILVGENGTGKSTVANFIYSFLTGQWSRLLKYDFKSIFAEVDGQEFKFSREDITTPAQKRLPTLMTLSYDEVVRRHKAVSKLQSSVDEQSRSISQNLGIPINIVREELAGIDSASLEFKEKIRLLKISMAHEVLYLPTYRRIEQDLKEIFPDLIEQIEKYSFSQVRNKRSTELVEFGMKDVVETINEKLSQIKEAMRQDLSNLTGTYLHDVIQGTYQTIDPIQLQQLETDEMDTLFRRIPSEILPEQDKQVLKNIISKIKQSGEIQASNRVVAHFLTKLIELQQQQQDNEKDIRQFVQVCNEGYLSGKILDYDDVNFKVSIVPQGITNRSANLSLRALSSGEKQIISLFSHLYLSGKSNFFMIIDEPELSLSLPWQRRFLPDILAKCNGLIAVTHSPFIYENELEPYTHSLEEFIEPYMPIDEDFIVNQEDLDEDELIASEPLIL